MLMLNSKLTIYKLVYQEAPLFTNNLWMQFYKIISGFLRAQESKQQTANTVVSRDEEQVHCKSEKVLDRPECQCQ